MKLSEFRSTVTHDWRLWRRYVNTSQLIIRPLAMEISLLTLLKLILLQITISQRPLVTGQRFWRRHCSAITDSLNCQQKLMTIMIVRCFRLFKVAVQWNVWDNSRHRTRTQVSSTAAGAAETSSEQSTDCSTTLSDSAWYNASVQRGSSRYAAKVIRRKARTSPKWPI